MMTPMADGHGGFARFVVLIAVANILNIRYNSIEYMPEENSWTTKN